jgi:hypothetical protein
VASYRACPVLRYSLEFASAKDIARLGGEAWNSELGMPVRMLYTLGLIGLIACIGCTIGTLVGFDMLGVMIGIVGLLIPLYCALAWCGFYNGRKGFDGVFGPAPSWKELFNRSNRDTPGFTRYVVYASWLYALIGLVAVLWPLMSYGGSVCTEQPPGGRCRVVTLAEMHQLSQWYTLGLSMALTQFFLFPALYRLFYRKEPIRRA